jgi:hypothetical protein
VVISCPPTDCPRDANMMLCRHLLEN